MLEPLRSAAATAAAAATATAATAAAAAAAASASVAHTAAAAAAAASAGRRRAAQLVARFHEAPAEDVGALPLARGGEVGVVEVEADAPVAVVPGRLGQNGVPRGEQRLLQARRVCKFGEDHRAPDAAHDLVPPRLGVATVGG